MTTQATSTTDAGDAGPLTYRYGPEDDHVGDLWLPRGEGPHRVAVVVHGGFWRAFYKRDLMHGLCRDLAGRGWAAWNIEYRRVGAGGGWPTTFRDVATAIDLLDLLAERHPLDLARLAAVGHSAGGHLALWSVARASLPAGAPGADPIVRPAAVVSLAGVNDLRLSEELEQGAHAAADLLGGSPDSLPERYDLASPAERLPLGVAQTLVHGDGDANVAIDLSERYAERARSAGDEVELVRVPGADHFAVIDPEAEAWSQAAQRLESLVPADG